MTAFVRYLKNGDIEIRTPYNAAFVEALKSQIPYDNRSWDGVAKLWTVRSWFSLQAIRLIEHYYENVEIERYQDASPPPPPPTGSTSNDPFRVLHLLPTAPPPVIHAVYKTMARIYHPDTGGDTAMMQRINSAYDKIKERTP